MTCLLGIRLSIAGQEVTSMNIQLHRKQIVILGLAMVLAVASYWIPTPQRPLSPTPGPSVSKSVGHSQPITATFDREVATSRRFSVAESVAQTVIPSHFTSETKDASLSQAQANSQFLSFGDFAKGKIPEVDYTVLMPVKNLSL